MNDQADHRARPEVVGRAIEAELAQRCADATAIVFKLREKLRAGMEVQFVPAATALGQLFGKVHQFLSMKITDGYRTQQGVEGKIREWIERRLRDAEGVVQLCEAKMAKACRKQREKEEREAARMNTSTSAAPTSTSTNGSNSAPFSTVPTPGALPSYAESGVPPEPFPNPPTPQELEGLIIPFPDHSGAIDLALLPAELWSPANPQRFWLSLEPTPLARVQLPTLRFDGESVKPGGTTFLNVGLNLDSAALAALLGTFGLPEGSYIALSLEEAWIANSDVYGPIVTGAAWDYFGLPHPPVTPQMGPLGSPQAIPDTAKREREPPPTQPAPEPPRVIPGLPFPLGNPLDRIRQAAADVVPPVPAIPAALSSLRMPTRQELCDALDPVYAFLGLPQGMRPPCNTLQEMRAWVNARLASGDNANDAGANPFKAWSNDLDAQS